MTVILAFIWFVIGLVIGIVSGKSSGYEQGFADGKIALAGKAVVAATVLAGPNPAAKPASKLPAVAAKKTQVKIARKTVTKASSKGAKATKSR